MAGGVDGSLPYGPPPQTGGASASAEVQGRAPGGSRGRESRGGLVIGAGVRWGVSRVASEIAIRFIYCFHDATTFGYRTATPRPTRDRAPPDAEGRFHTARPGRAPSLRPSPPEGAALETVGQPSGV